MTIIRHELRQGRTSFLVGTCAVSFFLAVCVLIFPEFKDSMSAFNTLFASMGAFTAAFGMDKLNFGTLIGYYAIECGNVLGLCGAFYAALISVSMLSKEEHDRTAEFLFTHPVSRKRVLTEKLAAIFLQITAMNLIVYVVSVVSILLIGEPVPWKTLNLLHAAYLIMQYELAGICYGISAFMRRGSAGAGLGAAVTLYVMNLAANMTGSAAFLKYITPYGYCDGAGIVSTGSLDGGMIAIGVSVGCAGIAAAYLHYLKKDIQ